ncbi:hypothetical protein H3H36_02435 [Duganella sp. FT3S]|uniref:DUF2946 domain-containing protein n=1 Tax=Rugamonas fusca TaxID=2758568 RepID=A0A7W2I5F6_9BURK|nr:hypothetical protein [Rugamonas fusca]MBA5604220.1 hypothetical protein [Rugamonas fusca]
MAAQKRGTWHWSVMLLTTLSFLFVISTTATHIHKTASALQDCAICYLVADQLGDVPAPPSLIHDSHFQPYHLVAVTVQDVVYSSPQLLPPSCGPPYTSV